MGCLRVSLARRIRDHLYRFRDVSLLSCQLAVRNDSLFALYSMTGKKRKTLKRKRNKTKLVRLDSANELDQQDLVDLSPFFSIDTDLPLCVNDQDPSKIDLSKMRAISTSFCVCSF